MSPTREVFEGDAIAWLAARPPLPDSSIVTSLPDVSELAAPEQPHWSRWFVDAAARCARALAPAGLLVLYQTDTKHEGRYTDKARLASDGALGAGLVLVFHRIVLRARPGTVTPSRAGYSHLLGFAHAPSPAVAHALPDVIADAGRSTWTRGMGTLACVAALEAVRAQGATRTVLDPFCGHGTVLAVANAMGLDAVGVELGARRAKRARSLSLASIDPALAASLATP